MYHGRRFFLKQHGSKKLAMHHQLIMQLIQGINTQYESCQDSSSTSIKLNYHYLFLLASNKKVFLHNFYDSKTCILFLKSTLISVQYSTRLSMINNRPPYITIRVVKCIPLCNVNVCKITSVLNNVRRQNNFWSMH